MDGWGTQRGKPGGVHGGVGYVKRVGYVPVSHGGDGVGGGLGVLRGVGGGGVPTSVLLPRAVCRRDMDSSGLVLFLFVTDTKQN